MVLITPQPANYRQYPPTTPAIDILQKHTMFYADSASSHRARCSSPCGKIHVIVREQGIQGEHQWQFYNPVTNNAPVIIF